MTTTAWASAITRAMTDLSQHLSTATVDVPEHHTYVGFRITTTKLLTRQLDDDPDGYMKVKRRVMNALELDDDHYRRVGIYIARDRGTIDLVVAGPPLAHLTTT